MKKNIMCIVAIWMFCLCQINAQTLTALQLNKTKWHLVEPKDVYVDTYFEFSDSLLTNISNIHYPDTKMQKGFHKTYTNNYLYYVSNMITEQFDKKQVGTSSQGQYILQELDGDVFWFQVLKFTSTELKLKSLKGQIFTFERISK